MSWLNVVLLHEKKTACNAQCISIWCTKMSGLRRNVVWRFNFIYVCYFLSSKWVRSTGAASCETSTKHICLNENMLVHFVCGFLCLFYPFVENSVTDFENLHNRNSIRFDSIWNSLKSFVLTLGNIFDVCKKRTEKKN